MVNWRERGEQGEKISKAKNQNWSIISERGKKALNYTPINRQSVRASKSAVFLSMKRSLGV